MNTQPEEKGTWESRLQQMESRLARVERRARAMGVLAVFAVAGAMALSFMPPVTAEEATLEARVLKLEKLLRNFSREGNDVFITGANLHIRNGIGGTQTKNGAGNLIVGYNELPYVAYALPTEGPVDRTGSHNIVVGQENNFSSFGGLVVGFHSTISGRFASVSGGFAGEASADWSSVSGGFANRASGWYSSVSGGYEGEASGESSSVSGGDHNRASGIRASVTGGGSNEAVTNIATVSGGYDNTAAGFASSVSGGRRNSAGGAGARYSSISGGYERTVSGEGGEYDWRGGGLLQDY